MAWTYGAPPAPQGAAAGKGECEGGQKVELAVGACRFFFFFFFEFFGRQQFFPSLFLLPPLLLNPFTKQKK